MSGGERKQDARPLAGIRVIELAGLGPVPFAAMLLADMGADVVRIARTGHGTVTDGIDRGRRIVELDLADDLGRKAAFDLVGRSDVLLEGFRPGVLERMGLAPERLHAHHPALVIGRMSAWGQAGTLANSPGHDINVLALSGLLSAIGPVERPVIPLNLVADYGGGALYLALGVTAALLSARTTGIGQTIDCAMYDGVVSLMALQMDMLQAGRATPAREANLLDGGAPFYAVYACADGGFIAVGAIEPKFYANLLDVMRLTSDPVFAGADQHDRTAWPQRAHRLAEAFGSRTRAEWITAFDGIEACVTAVLDFKEATDHAHARERGAFVRTQDGRSVPAPAPRFGQQATPGAPPRPADVADIMAEWTLPVSTPAGSASPGTM